MDSRLLFHGPAEQSHSQQARRERSPLHRQRSKDFLSHSQLPTYQGHRPEEREHTHAEARGRVLWNNATGQKTDALRGSVSIIVRGCFVLRLFATSE